MMKSRFWRALDEIPAATTDLHEWREVLGADLSGCLPFLRSTGVLAREIGCPSPGGEGCPRRVVPVAEGQFRAVCGQKPAECEALDLSQSDISLFALDRMKLAGAVARAFQAVGEVRDSGDWMALGRFPVSAGAGIDLVLPLPRGPRNLTSIERDLADRKDTGVIVPTARSLPPDMSERLVAHGNLVVALSGVASIDKSGMTVLETDPAIILAAIRDRLLAKERDRRLWVLPAGARWGELLLDLISDEVLNVRFRGETRRFEPNQFGMKSGKSGRPTVAWAILRAFCLNSGTLPRRHRRGGKEDPAKQKQVLSAALRSAFGIGEEPIPWRRREGVYQALFLARDSRPKHAREAARRKFVDD